MAYADAVQAGVGIDPDRRLLFIRSGLTDDQINHIYGFVYDPEAVGPRASLDPRKIQEAALRFYDISWDVDRHRDSRASLGRNSRPLMQRPRKDTRRPIILGPGLAARAAARKSPGGRRTSRQKMATSKPIRTTFPPPGRKLTWKPTWKESLTGSTVICKTPTLLTLT